MYSKVPKRPYTGRAKIKYIAPRPTTKIKEEEEIDTTVYERLYKVDVYTGESGINASVSFISNNLTIVVSLRAVMT